MPPMSPSLPPSMPPSMPPMSAPLPGSSTVPYVHGPDSGPPPPRPAAPPARSSHGLLVVALVVVLLLIGGGLAFAWHLLQKTPTPRSSTYASNASTTSTTERNLGASA
jgi:hypothetical protein